MLELKTIRHLRADKDFLSFLGKNISVEVKTTDGAILEVKKTNIQTIKPIVYEIEMLDMIIYHYASDMLNSKKYYLPKEHKSYTLNQLKEMIRTMINQL